MCICDARLDFLCRIVILSVLVYKCAYLPVYRLPRLPSSKRLLIERPLNVVQWSSSPPDCVSSRPQKQLPRSFAWKLLVKYALPLKQSVVATERVPVRKSQFAAPRSSPFMKLTK